MTDNVITITGNPYNGTPEVEDGDPNVPNWTATIQLGDTTHTMTSLVMGGFTAAGEFIVVTNKITRGEALELLELSKDRVMGRVHEA